jgi:glutamate-1-semialdehyde 2,1-aminomutase
VGSIFPCFFTSEPITAFDSAKKRDTALFGRFFRTMLDRGVYPAPSQFEAAFLSATHSERDIDQTTAAGEAIQAAAISTAG